MVIQEIIQHVKDNMLGRMCDEHNNVEAMVEAVLYNGNHLEIGTLHGGSAIVVALAKRELGFTGDIFCIDPLNGLYVNSNCPRKWWSENIDPVTKIPISMETIQENMKRFDVELNIIQSASIPFPLALDKERFETVYIDGDHWGNAPLIDFINVCHRTDRFIIFDNCDKTHPDVMTACNVAEKVWKHYLREKIICIVSNPVLNIPEKE